MNGSSQQVDLSPFMKLNSKNKIHIVTEFKFIQNQSFEIHSDSIKSFS